MHNTLYDINSSSKYNRKFMHFGYFMFRIFYYIYSLRTTSTVTLILHNVSHCLKLSFTSSRTHHQNPTSPPTNPQPTAQPNHAHHNLLNQHSSDFRRIPKKRDIHPNIHTYISTIFYINVRY